MLDHWIAASVVDSQAVAEYGIEKCFTSEMIPDSIFNLMQGRSYHNDSPVKRSDLRYLKLLHYNAEGEIRVGEMVAHKSIAKDLVDIFRNLYDERYPIERMVLVDNYDGDDEASMSDNNTSCYNCRNIHGSKRKSLHAKGIAVDINPLYNPYVKTESGKITKVQPQSATIYVDRHETEYILRYNDACYRQFISHGFSWGGNWKRTVKDYQHFQKNLNF